MGNHNRSPVRHRLIQGSLHGRFAFGVEVSRRLVEHNGWFVNPPAWLPTLFEALEAGLDLALPPESTREDLALQVWLAAPALGGPDVACGYWYVSA